MEIQDEFKELEYKYNGNSIRLTEFVKLMAGLNSVSRSDVSSWDYYFTSASNEEEFMRYRESDRPELTIKRKTKSANNWERVEIDLPLDLQRIKLNKVETFGRVLGYSENFRIYKTCFIFWLENVNYVYYIVYNKDMVEQDRYLEVEVNKERVPILGVEKAVEELKAAATKLTELGLTPQHRLKKSLFEIYRK